MATLGDFAGIAALAHQLKGAGGSVGYGDVTVVARSLEEDAKCPAPDLIAILTHIDHLEHLSSDMKVGLTN